ncbi:Zn-dependent protease with chaperone function [Paenibacillus sp. 1_12]|uniref:M48 family metallopeptidase n=1 Tax=Paenibacillus sp. 1_12 TaxID=1566278 RepID=UPI0008E4E748|nr:M48 family metallopeptidase [Paenibacillus sp. 1_12]SFL67030.1 Zn-dependent protease with chaperone function [Paenibacillus sp. 1_12]
MNSRLVHEHETTWYVICLVISLLCYISLIFSVVGIIYIVIGIIITLILHGLMVAGIRSSGVKLTERQFPEVYWHVQDLCRQMGIVQVPDVFIVQSGGVLNAFATRFFGRNFVVLYSEIFELIEQGNEDELSFVLAHELAHIQRKHMTKHLWILPALWIPFLGNAYSRACEFTCDRIATAYIGDAQTAVRGLTILAVGKKLFPQINIPDYLEQSEKERGFFIGWYRLISTHPPLPNRIDEILRFQAHPHLFGYDSIRFETEDTKLSS